MPLSLTLKGAIVLMKASLPFEGARPRGTIAALDGVRAIACLMVIAYHISLMALVTHLWSENADSLVTALMLAGNAGVTLFFVLSGFLLFLPYANALLVVTASSVRSPFSSKGNAVTGKLLSPPNSIVARGL
jgi:hypothetical protein